MRSYKYFSFSVFKASSTPRNNNSCKRLLNRLGCVELSTFIRAVASMRQTVGLCFQTEALASVI